jgi:hypothetical protein
MVDALLLTAGGRKSGTDASMPDAKERLVYFDPEYFSASFVPYHKNIGFPMPS